MTSERHRVEARRTKSTSAPSLAIGKNNKVAVSGVRSVATKYVVWLGRVHNSRTDLRTAPVQTSSIFTLTLAMATATKFIQRLRNFLAGVSVLTSDLIKCASFLNQNTISDRYYISFGVR